MKKLERTGRAPVKTQSAMFFQPKLAQPDIIQRDATASEKDNGTSQDCKGWDSDPQSFCIRAAQNFLETEFGMNSMVTKVDTTDDGGCSVFFENGVVITVQKMGGQKVYVGKSSFSNNKIPSGSHCYDYACFTSGKIVFTRSSC